MSRCSDKVNKIEKFIIVFIIFILMAPDPRDMLPALVRVNHIVVNLLVKSTVDGCFLNLLHATKASCL